ncbi:MAG TPA: hypothetical protein VGJ78_19580 [Vicinamibacterales bacterium]|jgi:hypothetical protein
MFRVTRILDRPETRVAQVEIPANDTRPLHSHPEALWHVFVTTDAPMDLLIEGEPTVHLGPWQAHFFKGGVRWVEFFALKTGNPVAVEGPALHFTLTSNFDLRPSTFEPIAGRRRIRRPASAPSP